MKPNGGEPEPTARRAEGSGQVDPRTVDTREELFAGLREMFEASGWSYQQAAARSGISASTIHGWLSDDPPTALPQRETFKSFVHACSQDVEGWLDAYSRTKRRTRKKSAQEKRTEKDTSCTHMVPREHVEALVKAALEYAYFEMLRSPTGVPLAWVNWSTSPPTLARHDNPDEELALWEAMRKVGVDSKLLDQETLRILRLAREGKSKKEEP